MGKSIFISIVCILFLSCTAKQAQPEVSSTNTEEQKNTKEQKNTQEQKNQSTYVNSYTDEKINKSEEAWKAELSDNEYYILRDKGTERAFTGDLVDHKIQCIYTCRGCKLPLFSSETKFKSGTGWPSFYAAIDESNVATDTDYILGYPRTEILCARCDGHLGHVFEDGPQPTGLRYCVNSASLDFEEAP